MEQQATTQQRPPSILQSGPKPTSTQGSRTEKDVGGVQCQTQTQHPAQNPTQTEAKMISLQVYPEKTETRSHQEQQLPAPRHAQTNKTDAESQKIKKLQSQIQTLKKMNNKLKHELMVLSSRLDEQIAKRQATKSVSPVHLEKQLENRYKQNEILKRQIKILQKQADLATLQRVKELESTLKQKAQEMEKLQAELKSINKIKSIQEKTLEEVSIYDGSQLPKCLKDNQTMQEELRRLQNRCNTYERQARKHSLQHKEIVRVADARVPELEKEIQSMKEAEAKSKKLISQLTNEKVRLKEQIQHLNKKIKEKDKDIESLNNKMTEIRRCLRPNRMVRVQTEAVPEPHIVNQAVYESPKPLSLSRRGNHLRTRTSSSSHKSIQRQSEEPVANSKKLTPDLEAGEGTPIKIDQSEVSLSTPKVIRFVKNTGTRVLEAGEKCSESIAFNHHSYSSKIKELSVSIKDEWIQCVSANYQKGRPPMPVPSLEPSMYFICDIDEYVHKIRTAWDNGFLSSMIVQTNRQRQHTFGKPNSNNPTEVVLDIKEDEFPICLFGELTKVKQDYYRINRIGCFVESQHPK